MSCGHIESTNASAAAAEDVNGRSGIGSKEERDACARGSHVSAARRTYRLCSLLQSACPKHWSGCEPAWQRRMLLDHQQMTALQLVALHGTSGHRI